MPATVVITGNEAAATAAKLARVQVIAAYPITPQSPVVEQLSAWVESGELPAEFVTVESEHSALTVCITASTVGARVFTATSANGLAYMTEQVWWAAGARLPIVMCVANRAMAAPWNVLNDQQDSMSVRDAGWIQLYCRDNQEILDTTLAGVPHRRAAPRAGDGLLRRLPALAHGDAGRAHQPPRSPTSSCRRTRRRLRSSTRSDPRNIGAVTIADPRADADGVVRPGYMEVRQQLHATLLEALDVIPAVDTELGALTGREWGGLTWEYQLDDAELVLVAAGSLGMQLTVAVDQLRAQGVKAGVLGIRCYRPFPAEALRAKLAGRKGVLVFDKAVSYGNEGPICGDVRASLYGEPDAPVVWGAICGLGGRDVSPEQLTDAALRALADGHSGMRHRPTDWINLKLTGGAR